MTNNKILFCSDAQQKERYPREIHLTFQSRHGQSMFTSFSSSIARHASAHQMNQTDWGISKDTDVICGEIKSRFVTFRGALISVLFLCFFFFFNKQVYDSLRSKDFILFSKHIFKGWHIGLKCMLGCVFWNWQHSIWKLHAIAFHLIYL